MQWQAHYLLELMQNVDDCQYPEGWLLIVSGVHPWDHEVPKGEKPTLRLTYESRQEIVE